MAESLGTRLKHAWNVFRQTDYAVPPGWRELGPGYGIRPDRNRLRRGNEKSIVASIYNRIAIDVASVNIQHVRIDQNGSYLETIPSGLNECLTVAANVDQTGRAFIQDVVMSMFDEGSVAIVPTITDVDILTHPSFEIGSLRTGKITEWYPQHVRVNVYNEKKGQREDLILPKRVVAIIENPLYAVMNEPNSTVARLVRKLNLLDAIDEQSGSGKLDLIIQLPYVIKTEARKQQAEQRRSSIEEQLSGSRYGIAYTDGTERVTQLNRPSENNLLAQVTYLTTMVYNQLGLAQTIFDGTADEKTQLNYFNKSIEPILSAIADALIRTYLTKTARTQKQTVLFFREPFKLVPVADLAEIADKFTRNEILTSNEFRSIVGYKPSDDPRANELRNANMGSEKDQLPPEAGGQPIDSGEQDAVIEELFAGIESDIDSILGGIS